MRRETETRLPLPVVLRHSSRRWLIVLGVLGRLLANTVGADDAAVSSPVAVGPVWQLRISPAATAAARFLQTDPASNLKLTSTTPLAAIRRLDQAPRTQDLRPWLPIRLVQLRNGDRLAMSVVRMTQTELHVVDDQLRPLTIPRVAILAIEHPAGIRTTQYADSLAKSWKLEAGSATPIQEALGPVLQLSTDAVLKWPLDQPLSVGQFVLWIKVADSQSTAVDIRFEFTDGPSHQHVVLELRDGGRGTATCRTNDNAALNTQVVRLNADWVCVRALLTETQFTIAADLGVTAIGERLGRQLTAIRVVRTAKPQEADQSIVCLGPVFAQEFVSVRHPTPPLASGVQDAVQLQSGDCLFGSIATCDQQHVVIKVRRDDITLPSRDVVSIRLGQRSIVARPVSGWVARIKLQGQRCHASDSIEDVLQGAIVAADADGLEFDHSLIGRRRIEWARLRQIEPVFVGSSQLIDAGPHHLGTRSRDDFQHAAPEGTKLAISATIDGVPSGQCCLSLLASNLEPAGPDTLRASPTLKDVRAEFFATSVFVNGTLVGRLNDFTSQWGSKANPVRIRLPLPSQLLRRGVNEIEFRQSASRTDATSFNDCELRNIALECEPPS